MRSLELFCCSGGMALGFKRAYINFDLAIDYDKNACDSYEKNLGHRPLQIDARQFLKLVCALYQTSRLDLLVADPPCTPWSRAGKRQGLEDERDMLATTAAIISVLRPRTWLVGNVPGLDDATNLPAIHRTLGRLEGYCIDFVQLDAASYGVPQHRVRPFWFGHPLGSHHIQWPKPTHGHAGRQLYMPGCDLLPYVTVRDALQHLTPRELGRKIRIRAGRNRHGHPPSVADRPSMTICSGQPSNGGGVLAYGKGDHRPSRSDRPARTLTTNPMSDGALVAAQPGRNGRKHPQSWNAVKLSEKAAAILQGFPDGWHFAGSTKRARWAQIGMAMPPGLAHAVASAIAAWHAQDTLAMSLRTC